MKKKLMLIFVLIFFGIFLIFPSYGFHPSGLGVCRTDIINGPQPDCEAPVTPQLGGGIKYLLFMLEFKKTDPSSSQAHYFYLVNGEFFQPLRALEDSIAISTIVTGVLAVLLTLKRTKTRKQ